MTRKNAFILHIFIPCILAVGLLGCGDPDAGPDASCPGETVSVDGENTCVVQSGIQETGFSCPGDYPFLFEGDDGEFLCAEEPPEDGDDGVTSVAPGPGEDELPQADDNESGQGCTRDSWTVCVADEILLSASCSDGNVYYEEIGECDESVEEDASTGDDETSTTGSNDDGSSTSSGGDTTSGDSRSADEGGASGVHQGGTTQPPPSGL